MTEIRKYQNDWNLFARDILGVRLDTEQQECLHSIQTCRRVSIRSGNSRGKDFVAAAAALCWLYLNYPSKVIETAPTGRQALDIMMAEVSTIHGSARVPLGGEVLRDHIRFGSDPNWYLTAFKAGDAKVESWTGFHSPNLMVIISEASGIEDTVFDSMESILTGNSRLVMVFNPNRTSGEAYRSISSPAYRKHRLNCLNAPNVREKRIVIPGQVDYGWVCNLIHEKRWALPIDADQARPDEHDFEWEGQWYRPNDLFRVKVLGEPPKEGESVLVPLDWIRASFRRWETAGRSGDQELGVDVAGMGRDFTVVCRRYGMYVEGFDVYSKQDHMATVGKIVSSLSGVAKIDTIGEGAGVHSRCLELGVNSVSAKFSEGCDLRDYSDERTFANMRAWCYWAVRDALDPQYGQDLALPPDDELEEELHAHTWKQRSNGDILLDDKDGVKKMIGRSPDKSDALALSFYPDFAPRIEWIA
jgi:hypothetical protein